MIGPESDKNAINQPNHKINWGSPVLALQTSASTLWKSANRFLSWWFQPCFKWYGQIWMMKRDIFENMIIGDECPVPRGNKLPRPAQPLKTPSLTCKWSKSRGSGRAKLTQDLIVSPLKNVLFTYCYALPCPDIDPCPAHVFSFSQKLGFYCSY